jgi:hypothetical protein
MIEIGSNNHLLLNATLHYNYIPDMITGTCGDNLTWSLRNSTGNLVIDGEGDMTQWDKKLDVPWYKYCENVTSATIGDGVTRIGKRAFEDCTNLTSITIPDSVQSIDGHVFANCHSLTSITIPKGVTNIDPWALYSCKGLSNITVDPANTAYTSDIHGTLFNKDKTTLVRCPSGNLNTEYVIPTTVSTIEQNALRDCQFVSVTIPDSVTSIGFCSFCGCKNLTSIAIPNGVIEIPGYTFAYCTSLTTVIIGNGITRIQYNAFDNDINITDVYYAGTKDQWDSIYIDTYNSYLTSATIHYNYTA